VVRPWRKGKYKGKGRVSYYPLHEVRLRIRKGKVLVTGSALEGARQDFNWGGKDVIEAVLNLKPKHFYKTEECKAAPGEMVDYYRAKGLKGENVYIHFYIDIATDTLIIQSCKKLEERS